MSKIEKAADASLTLASIGLDLVTQNYVGAALQSLGAIKDFARETQEAKLGRWWKGVVEGKTWEGKTPQEIQGLIEAKLSEDPTAKETIWAAAKAVLETISDEASGIIGSLTDEYIGDGKGPDAFFRGTVRVLADLSTEELLVLRRITTTSHATNAGAIAQVGDVVEFTLGADSEVEEPMLATLPAKVPEVRRVIRLLRANDLSDSHDRWDDRIAAMRWNEGTVARLYPHLR